MNLASETLGKKDKDLSHKAAEALQKYDWPGNIRELRNAVERAMALCMGSSILIEDLPEYIRDGYYNKDLKSVEDAEKELIIKTLRITEGNKKEAAKRLGIGIASLYRKIKKWNIKQ